MGGVGQPPGQHRARPLLGAGRASLWAGERCQGAPHANLCLNAGHDGNQTRWKWKISIVRLKKDQDLRPDPRPYWDLPYQSPRSYEYASHPLRVAQSCFPAVQGATHIYLTSSPGCCIPHSHMHSVLSDRALSFCVCISIGAAEFIFPQCA